MAMPPPKTPEELNQMMVAAKIPQVLTAPRITTPALVVLLGSTPAKAAMELCYHLLSLTPQDRRRVALVYIDTDAMPDDVVSFRKAHENVFQDQHVQRIAVPVGINHIDWPQSNSNALGWPDLGISGHNLLPTKAPQYFANGAGGIRNNGHVAAANDHWKIVQALESALTSLERVSSTQGAVRVSEVQANIVAFLGGGTGSGILGDVAVMVRQMLTKRQYQQRLNLFCILPEHILGAAQTNISWRQSNATACLLELLALSLAAEAPGNNGRYVKYLYTDRYELTADPIANEVYLIGRTGMASPDDAARIVGLDLFQRITDASGVGFLEHSTWVNRFSLAKTDDRKLPTMFGTSCPMEVQFPARETARAFAQVSAAYLLPYLVGREPPLPDVDALKRTSWVREWDEVAELTLAGRPFAVRPPDEFPETVFVDASQDVFDNIWNELERRYRATEARINLKIGEKRQEEIRQMYGMPSEAVDARFGPLERQILHLALLEEEYKTIQERLKVELPLPVPDRPQVLEDRYLHPPMGIGFLRGGLAGEICDEYNTILRLRLQVARHEGLKRLIANLLQEVSQQLKNARASYRKELAEIQPEQLLHRGHMNAAWQGRLDRPHPHQRHIFDLLTLRAAEDDRSIATERLYYWATLPDGDRLQGEPREFGQRIADEFLERFMQYLRDNHTAGAYGDQVDGQNVHALLSHSGQHWAESAEEFFFKYYMKRFEQLNLFRILQLGTGQPAARISDYLLEHLRHIRGLMGSLIAFEPTLWREGAEQLDTTIYLSMRWDSGAEEQILLQALNALGALTDQGQRALPANMIDPHRLQVSYGQHGISLSTIPEFYRPTNSMMAEYLRHHGEWVGSQTRVIHDPRTSGLYGRSLTPVHSSYEMERLVCAPYVLGYGSQNGSQPQQQVDTSLRGRVIRDARPPLSWGSANNQQNVPGQNGGGASSFQPWPGHSGPGGAPPPPASGPGNSGPGGMPPYGPNAPGQGGGWQTPTILPDNPGGAPSPPAPGPDNPDQGGGILPSEP